MWQLISRCQGVRATLALVTVATCASCGGDAPPADATHKTQHSGNSPSTPVETPPLPPVAAISAPQTALVTPATAPDGSAEAALQKIAELIVTANAQARQAKADVEAGLENPASAQAYQEHLQQVINLATQIIAQTHLDPAAQDQFNAGVQYLTDARLELASSGDAEQARLLLEDADSLHERDSKSQAAAEAGYRVVELAERMARSLGGADREWVTEYAVQANQFAERFPEQRSRAAQALFSAGRLCDRFGMTDPARACLQRVQMQFAATPFAEQSAGILRRLSLEGQALELVGPTIEGGVVDIAHYRSDAVLVVFWSTTSPTFLKLLPTIRQIEAELAGRSFSIIGVNLDKDEAAVDAFLAQQGLTWPQVFSADPQQRGGRNPVARYYGVQVLPTCWLVAPGGVVAAVQPDLAALREAIEALLPRQ